jgi:NADP-dependent 3-hydroxy acid dehydrogenase YdfG
VKTALVTGTTSGIGQAIAIALAGAGYQVYAIGRSQVALNSLRAAASGIIPIALDLTDREAVEAAVSDLNIEVLVNNAGVVPPLGNFTDMRMSDIDSVLEINLSAVIVLTRLLAPQMRARQAGHIVFISSSAGHAPSPNFAVYAATKAGVSGFAASLRSDLSPYGVRVTEVAPGRVETQLYKGILDSESREAMYADNVAVQPGDVAAMIVAFLALPPSADVTRLDIAPTRPTPPIKIKIGE